MNRAKLSIGIAIVGLSAIAQAQVGPGPWSTYSPSFKLQQIGCGTINGSNFRLTCSAASGEQRAERRYQTFTSGIKQFQGTVRVNSLGGDRISVQQTFASDAFSILAVKKPGQIYQVRGGQTLADYSIGSSVRINAVCNVSARKVDNYVNGSLRQTQTNPPGGGSYYFKLGAYRTNSGRGPADVTWSRISFFQK
jgi:hypothetical protein